MAPATSTPRDDDEEDRPEATSPKSNLSYSLSLRYKPDLIHRQFNVDSTSRRSRLLADSTSSELRRTSPADSLTRDSRFLGGCRPTGDFGGVGPRRHLDSSLDTTAQQADALTLETAPTPRLQCKATGEDLCSPICSRLPPSEASHYVSLEAAGSRRRLLPEVAGDVATEEVVRGESRFWWR